MVSDVAVAPLLGGGHWQHYAAAALGAVLVVAIGKGIQLRHARA
jgi:hypothetical protein